MKKFIVILVMLTAFRAKAQESFGAATFSVPMGWKMNQTTNGILIDRVKSAGVCQILISPTQKGAVLSESEFVAYRNTIAGKLVDFGKGRTGVTRYEDNGLVSFFSIGTVSLREQPGRCYIYSLSNGQQTFFYQLLTTDNNCIEAFNLFMSGLSMEINDPKSSGTNAKRTKKATAPIPAAPPPMM